MRESDDRSGGDIGDGEILRGTKAIAGYLGVPQRMVSTLIRERGLPVALVGWWKVSTRRLVQKWIEQQAGADKDG